MNTTKPVMVGIDGSKAALRAAFWAADEAVARDVPLCLVHAARRGGGDADELARAEHVLHTAWKAVADTGKSVDLQTEVLEGDPAQALIDASERSVLMCLGHKGIHDGKSGTRGATAAAVLRGARSPVAMVRRCDDHTDPAYHRWIVVILDESDNSQSIFEAAYSEALLRNSPLLVLADSPTIDCAACEDPARECIRARLQRYIRNASGGPADVRVCVLAMPNDLLNMMRQSASIDQLLVLADDRTDLIDQLTGTHGRKVLRKSWCSLLVVRDTKEDQRCISHSSATSSR
ncbi:MAG: universal stress protein UspA-like protein [Mycobacterium sp.]|jgi:nucleotide-binding universal stress UspA family protein|uniref:universal stress protein n=1 Tax=Mycolicibacterium sp. P9-22 TaxID=2024613 RepID=UPI0011EE719A|nr:universal stress protein [Mycolicibacterium sp. P9-22]KAA0118327.1 universal stress protein [Mycolicibacterium sp. P9-22]MDF2581655.1 universal stress protein UspA-like protein [Mycobacterium sp.]